MLGRHVGVDGRGGWAVVPHHVLALFPWDAYETVTTLNARAAP